MTPLRRTSQLYLINQGEALPVLVAAMTGGTGRIYGGETSCSMPIIFVHRRRGVPRRPSRRRRPGPLPRLIISYYLKYHIRVCIRRIRTYATVCVCKGPGATAGAQWQKNAITRHRPLTLVSVYVIPRLNECQDARARLLTRLRAKIALGKYPEAHELASNRR